MSEATKILIVNPNTTAAVTKRFVAAARLVAPQARIEGVTGKFGAAIVSTEAENVIAGYAALDLLASHWREYDAVILAISFDTGLEATRELLPIPVVGITEAMLLAASAHGNVGMITFGMVSTPLYRRLVTRHGFGDRIVGIETIEIDSVETYLSPSDREAAMLAAARKLTERGADAIVVCGAAMIGAAVRLQPSVSVPVFDSVASALARAFELMGQRTATAAPKPVSSTSGISLELSALIAGAGFGSAGISFTPNTSLSIRKDLP
jgi:allantoin racemase